MSEARISIGPDGVLILTGWDRRSVKAILGWFDLLPLVGNPNWRGSVTLHLGPPEEKVDVTYTGKGSATDADVLRLVQQGCGKGKPAA